jgi:FkbM family methyltransferase
LGLLSTRESISDRPAPGTCPRTLAGMVQILRIVASDFLGLRRVCGLRVALRWLRMIVFNWRRCLATRSLQPADLAMGAGPFLARLGASRAKLVGLQVISGIREIWVRDVYLNRGMLAIPDNAVVVDLGANMGNFTMLALGAGPAVQCIAVEPDPSNIEKLKANLRANGWLERARICEALIGGETAVQREIETKIASRIKHISEEEFVREHGLKRIDLLKCDIEGSEFALLHPGSLLLAMSDQIAIELHKWGGDLRAFVEMLKSQGFETHVSGEDTQAAIVQARRRTIRARA